MTHGNANTGSLRWMLGFAAVVVVAVASPVGGLVETTGTAHAAPSVKVAQQQGSAATRSASICRSRPSLC